MAVLMSYRLVLQAFVALGFLWHALLLLQHHASSPSHSQKNEAQTKLLGSRGLLVLGSSDSNRAETMTGHATASVSSSQGFYMEQTGWISFQVNPSMQCVPDEDVSRAPKLLVLVHSHPLHKPQRDAIRDTWGRVAKDFDSVDQVRLVFLLGQSDVPEDMPSIHKESRMYRDIILADFRDTYCNLTIKSLTGMHWAITHCPEAEFILKTDDDVYFNVSHLLRILPTVSSEASIIGALNPQATVMRYGKWRVDASQYPADTYPSYCAGCAYLMRGQAASKIVSTFRQVPILPIEDVYVTGMVAKVSGLKCTNHPMFPHWYMGPSKKHICAMSRQNLLALHNVHYDIMYQVHQNLTRRFMCNNNVSFDHSLNKR